VSVVHAVFVQCYDGGYINVGSVYRWFINFDVANHENPFCIMASVAGPQHPFKIAYRSTEEGAQSTLDNILRTAAFPIKGGASLDQPSLGSNGD
jgi:hypothetical protein